MVVYTPTLVEYPNEDIQLTKNINQKIDVIHQPIIEPHMLASYLGLSNGKKHSGFGKKDKLSFKQKIGRFIRGNFFIPDARMLFIKPSIKYLTKYLMDNKIDVIISTGPPHSMHLIADGLKEKFPYLKWVADFRDPWTNIEYYDDLMLTNWANKKHKNLEKKVLNNSDAVVTVSNTWAEEFRIIADNKNIITIRNGFNLSNLKPTKLKKSNQKNINISYLGLLNDDRNHNIIWETMSALVNADHNISLHVAGHVEESVFESVNKYNLTTNCIFYGFIPHIETETLLQKSDILLLVINNSSNAGGRIPIKLYDYIAIGKPIICFGPSYAHDVIEIMNTLNNAIFINTDMPSEISLSEWIKSLRYDELDHNLTRDQYSIQQSYERYKTLVSSLMS